MELAHRCGATPLADRAEEELCAPQAAVLADGQEWVPTR